MITIKVTQDQLGMLQEGVCSHRSTLEEWVRNKPEEADFQKWLKAAVDLEALLSEHAVEAGLE